MYKLPERGGGGGGEVIWAMPERKHSFLNEVFPNNEEKINIGTSCSDMMTVSRSGKLPFPGPTVKYLV